MNPALRRNCCQGVQMVRPNRSASAGHLAARTRVMAVAVASCFAAAPAWALNEADLKAVVGGFTASQTGNVNVLTLTTATNRTLVEAQQRFNVQANEQFRVLQPSSSSLFLLRVLPGQSGILEKSVINGSIYSNGQFWLQNAAGVLIGKGAVIDTAGFLATTMAVRMEDFLAARLSFLSNPDIGSIGSIVNEGTITTHSGGSVYLIGGGVENKGVITTPGGETILAAGHTVSLVDTGTPGVKVEITGEQGNVTNLGEIVATAGRIGMAGVIVRNSGTLNASSVVSEGGRVFLKASKDTYVDGAGRIVATGTKGGKVEVLGERVAVMDQASIDVSGTNGGGTVLVGGDYQGKNADVKNATVTYFGSGASIKADATDNGDGGKVIVWADDTTRAYGNISARGGANGGNGGFVEVSGKHYLMYRGTTDVRAPVGEDGSLLLDPDSVTIVANDAAYGDETCSPCTSGNDSILTSASPGTAPTTIGWNTIQSALSYGDVTITTTNGDIDINGAPGIKDIQVAHSDSSGTWPPATYYGAGYESSNDLSLLANHAVNINTWFGNYGSGAITVMAGWNPASGTTTPAIYGGFTAGQSININSGGGIASKGAVTLKAVDSINIAAGANSAGIDVDNALISMLANKIALTGGNAGNNARAFIRGNGSQEFTVGTLNASGGLTLQGGSGAYYGNGAEIALYGTSGSQSFTIQNGATVELKAGSASGTTTSYSGECSVAPGCTDSRAEIKSNANGGQSLTFSNGGTLNVYGGSGGNGNGAGIENRGSGTQTISASAGSLNISLYGGSGGGATAVYGGKTVEFDNSAHIESKTGAQTISAASLALYGGSASYGGVFVTGPTQNITVSGALTMDGGSLGGHGSAPTAFDTYGGAIFYNPVVIGHDAANTVNLSVGSLTMNGGSSSNYGGSMALIGGYRVASNVTINSNTDINLASANAGGDRIGSFGGYGGSVTLRAGLSGAGYMGLGSSYISTGSTGSVTLEDSGAGAGISQAATGKIETDSLTVKTMAPGAGAINLLGLNRANTVNLDAIAGIVYSSYQSFRLTARSANGAINAYTLNGSPYGGDIAVKTVSTTTANSVLLTAYGGIYDDNATGEANIDSGTVILTAYGGHSGNLAISADVKNASSINALVGTPSSFGGIRINNVGTVAPTSVVLTDQSMTPGSGTIYYTATGDINMTSGSWSLSSYYGGINISSGGFLTLGGPATMMPGTWANPTYGYVKAWGETGVATGANMGFATAIDMYVGTRGTMTIGHDITNVRNIGLYATGSLNFLSGSSIDATTNAYLGGAASSLAGAGATSGIYGGGAITMTNSFVRAQTGTVSAYSGGDIRLNSGSYLQGGQGVNLGLGGATSTLYLNDSASYANPSYVLADAGMINVGMPGRSAAGVVIDGTVTDTSAANGSGFFVGTHATPAVKDGNLKIVYGVAATQELTTVVAEIVKSISAATSSTSDSSSGTGGGLPPLLPTSGTTSLASLTTATVGGGAGEFGSTETASTTTSTTTTTSTSTSGSGDSSTSSSTSGSTESSGTSSSAPGDQANGSKDSKEEKKDDKKDDKSKKADSGEKKDDKSKSKPVGKCSA